ncbi:SDR family oxidoreductase [Niveispirillum sp.]|uniref:SDR family NAD(P)-dependent oxidoreductase n=1 Tax=Niveispirillum sp. TaxID=1917217 RepID=UPI001B7A035D|nr:SDR family oxidoreductase [Niveispirillum sp.]MBP7336537.1 SDR family oxidoreductase [Niveispirillum sp.]
MQDLKIAVVIGGGNGIGAACCTVMHAHGWSVVVADKDEAAAAAVADRAGGRAFGVDVTDGDAVARLAMEVERQVGAPTALVVSSGIFQANMPVEQTPPDLFDRIMAVNVRGTYLANRAFGERMAALGRGAIVNLSSVTAHGSTPLNIYGPGKSAIITMSKSFAGEWGGRGVRVNTVSPGITLVPRVVERKRSGDRYPADLDAQMALGRCVEPAEVAEAVEFLCSPRASAITGTDLVVDCGWMTGALWAAYGGLRQR